MSPPLRKAIIHLDADAFFASVEQALNPALRGKPVVTGAERGIVTAVSYEARKFGIKRGEPAWEMRKKCPQIIFVNSNYEAYGLFSRRMFEIVRRYTPVVEEYSIDEAFCDITGFRRAYHASYKEIAQRMQNEIHKELGITVSVGLSINKVLAKTASKWDKPAGLTVITGMDAHTFLEKLEVGKIWGIGPRTAAYCNALGINTALDFARTNEEIIKQKFAKPQHELWLEMNGKEVYRIVTEEKTSYASISKTRTFTPPSHDRSYVFAQLIQNLENACIKARAYKLVAKRVSIFIKGQDFKFDGTELRLTRASSYPQDMLPLIKEAFLAFYKRGRLYRATGVVLTDLQAESATQLSLFEQPIAVEKMERLYEAIDSLTEKLGRGVIHLGASALARKEREDGSNKLGAKSHMWF